MSSFDKYVGQVFDNRYKITKILGIGGMAVVFEAFDTKLNRIVALKMLKDEISNDSQSVKRFINESKAVSMLAHPNIVSIYDVSVKDNLKYIVMERVDGITLKSYMSQKGVLSASEAISYVEQILRALEHAHSKGIIHRDIKPQNIMLLKNGRIKVTDFGIAKLPNAETVTMTDKAIGTVYYISPEQASGKEIDQRSDLYSLGVMMYEMVTGKLPFDAESPVSVALMQVNTKPCAPHEIKPDVSKGLEQIILLAMEKQPGRRFQNATQMLRHILQLKAAPNYVFKTKKTENQNVDVMIVNKSVDPKTKNDKNKKTSAKGGRSMFPVILGVVAAFLLVFSFSAYYLYNNYFAEKFNPDMQKTNKIEIPNLIDSMMDEDYKKELEDQGFKIIIDYTDEFPEKAQDMVVDQSPEPGTQRMVGPTLLCDIKVTLSLGEEKPVKFADYTTKDYLEAEQALDELGLSYTEEWQYSDGVDAGCIIRTDPVAGTEVYKKDTIVLYISSGQEINEVEMPNLINLTREEAERELKDAGLKLGKVNEEPSSAAAGTVTWQTPGAYETIPDNTIVEITISTGNE